MKVLIGHDGSESADAALDDLQYAGLPDDCEAHVMSVAEVWLPPPPPSAYEILGQTEESPKPLGPPFTREKQLRALEAAKVTAEKAADRLKFLFPKWELLSEACSGSPACELIFKENNWKPDLVVVGSQGRSALGRLVLGSVSQTVLAEAECSVRIGRGEPQCKSPARILVGTDGSQGAERALRVVGNRHWPSHSEARVVVVEDLIEHTLIDAFIPKLSQSAAALGQKYRQYVTDMVNQAAQKITSSNLTASGIVEEGNPKKVIVRLAEEWGASCVFVGSTGFSSRLERFLIGSVASAIASRAECSVEVVRERKLG